MIVLSRNAGQKIRLGRNVLITILEGSGVKIGINAQGAPIYTDEDADTIIAQERREEVPIGREPNDPREADTMKITQTE